MKHKIILGLAAYSLFFLLCGLLIIFRIDSATADLDRLITLHQVEILREHYLLQVKRVQEDLTLKDTRYERSFDTVVRNVVDMGRIIDTCFDCHHSGPVTGRLKGLKAKTESYKDALSRVLTIRANATRLEAEEDAAFRIGDDLIANVREMIAITSTKLSERTHKAMGEVARAKYFLYFLVALGPLLSAVLGYIFIAGLTSPVKVLVESTRKLKKGDLDHRVAGLTHEFGELATSFNEMAASLRDQMTKVQRAHQMAVVGALAAGLAHEIKNPLAGIKVAMHVLGEEAGLAEEDRAVTRRVAEEVARLEGLMKSFLNFAKPAKPQPAPLDVNKLINTTLAFHLRNRPAPGEAANGLRIAKDFGKLPETLADPMQIQQVFLNIFLNAIDAMPEGGTLSVRTFHDAGAGLVVIEIADTGKGIGRDQIDRIFQPFFTTKPKGTGLGLAISKQLVEQNGGTIEAGDNADGGGAVFRIGLPAGGADGGGRQ